MKTSNSFGDKIDQATEKMRPLLASTSQLGGVLVSIYHTSQVVLTMVPFILSPVAFFVAFPAFFDPYSTTLKYGVTILISLFAGFHTYSNYRFRERHDALIIENQNEIDVLKDQVKALSEEVKTLAEKLRQAENEEIEAEDPHLEELQKRAAFTPNFDREDDSSTGKENHVKNPALSGAINPLNL